MHDHGQHRFYHAFGPGFLGRGDFKYLVLELLSEKPRHGYEIIRAVEERTHGFYTPSPGVVYPTLQMLEDLGYVTVLEQDGKKTYAITDEGRAFLAERTDTVDRIRSHARGWWEASGQEELSDLMDDLRDLVHTVRRQVRGLDADKRKAVGEVVSRALHDIEEILKA